MQGMNIATTRGSKRFTYVYIYLILGILTLLCAFPLYIMFINATRSNIEILNGISFLPSTHAVQNYHTMQSKVPIWHGFINSTLITVPFTLLAAFFSSLTAYGFAMYDFKYKKYIFGFVLGTMMIPMQLGLIGYFEFCNYFGLLDTFFPLIITGAINTGSVFFIKQYTEQSLPVSLMEAARMDEASELDIYWRIALPIISPSIATMSIFNFVFCWNNYMGPLVLLFSEDKYPLPVLISLVRGTAYRTDFGAMYFTIALSILPIIVAYAFLSKYLISGLTLGAVKE
ncbi:MAG: carbohydrate ABC transporter permease [Spirochaetes bacterium]|jgi:multiple sugar transport system permease protein|nr:carbohydrate ABC transporter permease [Spirochaetota bacterium]